MCGFADELFNRENFHSWYQNRGIPQRVDPFSGSGRTGLLKYLTSADGPYTGHERCVVSELLKHNYGRMRVSLELSFV
jgi:hypothetical protein